MMIIYRESGRNSKAAARLYRKRFPHRRHPSSDLFLSLVNRTRTIAFLVPDRKRVGGVDRTVRTPDTEGVVLQSKNTVQNILKGNHMYPNHYTKVQRLLSEDYAPGTRRESRLSCNLLLLTDASYFCHKGTFTTHNLHVWSGENPQFEHLL
jgi:hypothetical protein